MSNARTAADFIKLFAISNQLLENQLDAVEHEFQIDLGRGHLKTLERDETYYPQFDRSIRRQRAWIAPAAAIASICSEVLRMIMPRYMIRSRSNLHLLLATEGGEDGVDPLLHLIW